MIIEPMIPCLHCNGTGAADTHMRIIGLDPAAHKLHCPNPNADGEVVPWKELLELDVFLTDNVPHRCTNCGLPSFVCTHCCGLKYVPSYLLKSALSFREGEDPQHTMANEGSFFEIGDPNAEEERT
jgi:hypothetical protein